MSVKCNYCQDYDKEYPNPKCINCRSGFNNDMNKPDYFECKFCDNYNFLKSIQREREENGRKVTYEYTAAFVDEIKIDGEARGKTTHYTWLPINYCPCCGERLGEIK